MMVLKQLKDWYGNWYNDGNTPLPKLTISILFLLFLVNSMTMTMAFSYLPKMVKWFGTSEANTGYYVGLIASGLFVGLMMFSFVWGYIADIKGKKPAIIMCTVCSAIATFAFGFSSNFYWALMTRFLQGCTMGLELTCKSMLREQCDDSNITLGMSILFCAFSVGLLTGPCLAGFMVFPAQQYPNVFEKDGLFGRFPVLLPNLFIAVGLFIALVLAIIFLPNEKRTSNNRYDKVPDQTCAIHDKDNIGNDLLPNKHKNDSDKNPMKNSKLMQVISNKWCVVCSMLFGIFSLTVIGFDEMFPLYASTSKVYGGLGLSPAKIGMILLIAASMLIVFQTAILPELTVKYGCKKMFIWSLLVFGCSAPLLPLMAEIHDNTWLWIALSLQLIISIVAIEEGFLTINIMLNNSVDSSLLGSANGFAMSLSSLGRAIGPSMFGSVYAWSLTNIKGVKGNVGALGFPLNQYLAFLLMASICIICAVVALRLPETLNREFVGSTSNEDN